jgi:hypothetical protein
VPSRRARPVKKAKGGGNTLRVYIAGALSGCSPVKERKPSTVVVDYLRNVHAMCKAATTVRQMGHSPFVPALDLLLGTSTGKWDEEMYRGLSMDWLEVSDCVYVISESTGVERECVRAEELGIPVFRTLGALKAFAWQRNISMRRKQWTTIR